MNIKNPFKKDKVRKWLIMYTFASSSLNLTGSKCEEVTRRDGKPFDYRAWLQDVKERKKREYGADDFICVITNIYEVK